MRAILAAVALLCLGTPAFACQPFGGTKIAQLRATGVPVEEVEGPVLVDIMGALRKEIELPEPQPTKLVIVLGPEIASIAMVFDDKVCGIITAPSNGVRALLDQARGEPA